MYYVSLKLPKSFFHVAVPIISSVKKYKWNQKGPKKPMFFVVIVKKIKNKDQASIFFP